MTARDPITGQSSFDGDFARLCRCGHPLGLHVAGGHDCLNGSHMAGGDGVTCWCGRFRPLPSVKERKDG